MEHSQVMPEPSSPEVVVKIGALEMVLNEACRGTVRLDGKRVAMQRCTIEMEIGQPPKAHLDFLPTFSGGE